MKKDSLSSSSSSSDYGQLLIAPTAIIFGLVSILVYLFVIRPMGRQQQQRPTRAANNNNANNSNGTATTAGAVQQQQQQQPKVLEKHTKCTRVPKLVNDSAAKIAVNGGANLLLDGLVAFKHTKASSVAAVTAGNNNNNNNTDEIRKERAKVLARLLDAGSSSGNNNTSGSTPPPARGSAVVVAVPIDSVACPYQRRVLYLLATYYNLLVILGVVENGTTTTTANNNNTFDEKRRAAVIATLRCLDADNSRSVGNNTNALAAAVSTTTISEDVLPSHRIIVAGTVAGRVAFVRQVQRIELVVDFDPEVKGLLARFGHRVLVFEQQQQHRNDDAKKQQHQTLGQALLL